MKYPHNTSRCNNSQLRALLALGNEGSAAARENADLEQVLGSLGQNNPDAIVKWHAALAPDTDLETLSQIKTSAKLTHQQLTDAAERESASALYHVALAAALVRHSASISNRPIAEQVEGFERLQGQTGIPEADSILRAAIARWKPR